MSLAEKEQFHGPYLAPNTWFRGLVLLAIGGGVSIATLSVSLMPLLLSLPLAAFGGYLLYKSITRTPMQFFFYTLTPEGLLYAPPQPDVRHLMVPWDAMRRLETTAAPPKSLRLHFFAGNVTPDPVPKLGHKINEMLLGNAYRRFLAEQASEPVAQTVDLDPSMATSGGATFGERFPIWFARYAPAAPAD